MQIQRRNLVDADLRVALLPRLRRSVFHVTSQANFKKICRSGAIMHNKNARFRLNVTSENSFGRRRGWICLFDMRYCDGSALEKTLSSYNFLQPRSFTRYHSDHTTTVIAYLILHPKFYKYLVPNRFARKVSPYGHYVRNTEVWYRGSICLSQIQRALLAKIWMTAPKECFYRAHHDLAYQEQQASSNARANY